MAPRVNELHLLSKIATNDGHGEHTPYFDGWKAYDRNPYHPTQNPKGVIQMGLSENQLCFDLIEEWLKVHPEASICTLEGVSKFKDVAIFQDYHGLPTFRNAVANFMEKARGGRVKIDPDRIVMSGGATGAMDLISFCLADPGDAFLVPTPYYPAFNRDLRWRTGVQLLPIVCESSNNFQITRTALEAAYSEAQKANINVKGVIITNPSNPLGTLLDEETLKSLADFINQKNIHLVCDEIYSATVFNRPKFTSISEILSNKEANYINRNLIHIVYSLSKDLGLPGFRIGIVYSYNDAVVNCARKMSSFGMVSTQTQHLIAAMLSDDAFVENYLTECAKKLAARHKVVTQGLAKVGINCLKGNAGLFCWMDLRWLLREATVEGETALWRIIVNEVKLNVSPGSSFHCSEPGWFRVCFANMDDRAVEVALQRIQDFVAPMKNRGWKARLRLSSLPKRLEDVPKTPCGIMSPHSPLNTAMTPRGIMSPHSPIIHAIN